MVCALCMYAQPTVEESSWTLERIENHIKAYTRYPQGSPYKEFKVITHVAAPLDSVVKVVMDVERLAQANPYLKSYKLLKGDKQSADALAYFVFRAPFYTKDRDLVLKYDRSRTASGFIQYAQAEPDAHPTNPTYIRMPLANLITVVQPLGADSTEIIYRGATLPGGNAPAGYINRAMLKMPLAYVGQIRSLLHLDQTPAAHTAARKSH